MGGVEKAINDSMELISKDVPRYVLELYAWTFILIVISIIFIIAIIVGRVYVKGVKLEVKKAEDNIQNIRQTVLLNKNKADNLGEICVKNTITKAIENRQNCYLLNDVHFYNEEKHYFTQIDHVLVFNNYIFAIETKYWLGDTYLFKNRGINQDKNRAMYNNHIIANMKEKEINTYSDYNVMTQTARHAVNLKEKLGGNVNFVYGILVFVDNDNCKVHFHDTRIENIGITSLTELFQYMNRLAGFSQPSYPGNVHDEIKSKLESLSRK